MVVNKYIERYKFFLLSILFLLSAMLIETNFFNQRFSEKHVRAFENILQAKQNNSKKFCDELETISKNADFKTYRTYYKDQERLFSNQMLSFFIVKNNTLLFWSDNSITFPIDSLQKLEDKIIFLNHGWYITESRKVDDIQIFILTFIKSEFPYQNEFISNNFHSDFNLNSNIQISKTPQKDYYDVNDVDGKYILSLSKNNGRAENLIQRYFSIFLYFLGIIFLLVFMNNFLRKFRKRYLRDFVNIGFLIIVVFVRLWMIDTKVPYVCYTTSLFSANYYASSQVIPSLGDMLIDVLLLFYFIFQIQLRLRDWRPKSKFRISLFFLVFAILSNVLLYTVTSISKSLVYNSNIHLELYNLLDISFLSFVVYFIIGILLYSFFLLFIAFFSTARGIFQKFQAVILLGSSISINILLYFSQWSSESYWSIVFYVVSLAVFYYLYRNGEFSFSIGFKALLLLISIIFIQVFLQDHIQKKHANIKRLFAVNLTNEQDPVAEMLLKEIKSSMKRDTVLYALMKDPFGKDEKINKYLQKKYFGGFLNRYNLESTVCASFDSFPKTNQLLNCEVYFNKILNDYGISLSDTDYYYLNNQNGSISYFDSIQYNWNGGKISKLYIELNSKRVAQELGYPKLLLGDNFQQNKLLQRYSFAKFKEGKLLSQKGEYPYPLFLDINNKSEYSEYESYNYRHTVYKLNKNTTILVSHKLPTFFNQLVWFSYIFIYFFILITIYDNISESKFYGKRLQYTFTEKIRFSLFAVLFASLILTGVSLVLLNTNQQTKAQQKNVREKLQSILVEVMNEYEDYNEISPKDKEYFESMLVKFSNVFFTDINFYDPQGNLFASSRPEVFDYKLIGTKMHPNAYYRLAIKSLPEYVSKESIGELQFTSAYTVVTNSQNKVLGYLNLPYFTKQAELTQQITSLIVAILNIYVILLMLATVLAVFISNKITYPLTILRDKMKLVKIGSKNEKITWNATDEIGDLIANYNNMIDQLDISVKKLAESERDVAWREMAKQIAHEIKNPLTPIKLNIQLLNKSWEQKDEQFETRLKNISKSIIEQIDALAETANSFSNFAKITEGKPEVIILNSLIENCITLFGQEKNVILNAKIPMESIEIYADREKMLRLFNNIIKNAIQAIPFPNEGLVEVALEKTESSVIITVSDNGTGIPETLKERMFEPYFTTKSNGSGFGLAISKKIVEVAHGKIWFESITDVGTTFYIEFPLHVSS